MLSFISQIQIKKHSAQIAPQQQKQNMDRSFKSLSLPELC
jgi:hypothetical protein